MVGFIIDGNIIVTVSGKTRHVANLVSCIFDKLCPRANLPLSLKAIVHFALKLERFVYNCTTPTKDEKLWPKRSCCLRV